MLRLIRASSVPTASPPWTRVPWVTMASRKKPGSSSIRLSRPSISRSRRWPGSSSLAHELGDVFEQLVVHSLEARSQELVPIGEVDVDGGSGHPGLGGDVVHRDLGSAPLAEQTTGDVDDLVPAEVPDDLFEVDRGAAG